MRMFIMPSAVDDALRGLPRKGASDNRREVPLHERPHPLLGMKPANGQERAAVREWDAAKRRAELYANTTKEQDQ